MKPRKLLGIGLIALVVGSAIAQQQAAAEAKPARERLSDSSFILPGMLTEKMLNGILERMSLDMAEQYEFDDDQTAQLTELMQRRIPAFLKQHAEDISDLTIAFFEAQVSNEPPSVELVTKWGQRALPLVHEFRGMVTETAGEMGEFMTDDQRVRLEGELAAFETGIGIVNTKIQAWSEGSYDAATEWTPPGRARRIRENAERQAREAQMAAAKAETIARLGAAGEAASTLDEPGQVQPVGADPAAATAARRPVAPKDEWVTYTDKFIKRYQLDDAQTQKARSFLKDLQAQRDQRLAARSDDIARVTRQLKEAKSDEEKQSAQTAYTKLNAPIDRMFQSLKDKLDTLPTSKQRRAAAAAAIEADKASDAKPKADAPPAEPRP